ncbi:MAG: hypothetical protein WBD11_05550 [Xanthobacteraceae bacterium]|jgi:hypothetical protein
MVQFRANATGIVVAFTTALVLCGCANVEYENKDAWFAKPFEIVSRKGGYTFSELQETKERARAITANDLVDGNGSCPAPQVSQQAPQQAPAAAAAANQAPGVPPAADTNSLLGGGVALGMSECDVVFRAGSPSAVQVGKGPNGDRTAVLTFNSGPRPGIYHFAGGALTEVERVQGAPAPPSAQVAKKKPASASKASKQAAKE